MRSVARSLVVAGFLVELASAQADPMRGLLDGFPRGLRPLLANVVSDTDQFGNVDGRGSITEKAEQLGLSPAEVARIRKSSGYVVCPGKKYGNPAVGSGALVGSNMLVVTAAHVLIDDDGRMREPLSDCYFVPQTFSQTESMEATLVHIDSSAGAFVLGVAGAFKSGEPNDYAVLTLKSPVAGAIPFMADGTKVAKDEWVLGLTASQESPTRTFPQEEPVIQQCRVRGFQYPASAPLQYITDCDLSPLGSGGVLLTRDAKGNLIVRGIFTATGKEKLNGRPYDPARGSFARVVSTTRGFAAAIDAVRSAVEDDK